MAEIGQKPKGWKSIKYKVDKNENNGSFLDEKLYFEGSRVEITSGLSQIIEAMPPEKRMEMNALPLPTGIHSKIEFIKKLKNIASDAFVLKNKRSESVDLQDPFQNDENVNFVNALKAMNVSDGKSIDESSDKENVVKAPSITSGNSVMLWSTRSS